MDGVPLIAGTQHGSCSITQASEHVGQLIRLDGLNSLPLHGVLSRLRLGCCVASMSCRSQLALLLYCKTSLTWSCAIAIAMNAAVCAMRVDKQYGVRLHVLQPNLAAVDHRLDQGLTKAQPKKRQVCRRAIRFMAGRSIGICSSFWYEKTTC